MAKSGEKRRTVGKSREKWEKWLGLAICGFMVAKSGFMWRKVVLCGSKYVLPKR